MFPVTTEYRKIYVKNRHNVLIELYVNTVGGCNQLLFVPMNE